MVLKVSGRIKNIAVCFALVYFLFLTYQSASFKIDPHHDGHSYLSAYLGTFGIYPPQTSNVYGIAGPFIESKILLIFSANLIHYRYIAFFLICISILMIYKIISLKLPKTISTIFALLWISANPTWVSAAKGTLGHIQVVWPNLWIQTFLLIALYVLFNKKNINSFYGIFLGIIVASLPFFRIQGIASSILIMIIVLLKYRKSIGYFLLSLFVTIIFWLTMIHLNGGVDQYFRNIILNPLTIETYSQHRSFMALIEFMLHLGKYYVVIFIFSAIFILIALNFKTRQDIHKNEAQRIIPIIVLFCILILLVIGNYNIWVNTLYEHLTTILIDLSVPTSIIYIVHLLYRGFIHKLNFWTHDESNLIILSIMVISNLIYQYPLPDHGHRWWSSATSVIFIAYISDKHIKIKHIHKADFSIKYLSVPASVLTICFSLYQGVFFQQLETVSVKDNQNILNGMRYPVNDSETILNLQKSNKVLVYLEKNNIQINYYCRDGLYYLRDNGYSIYYKNSLNIFDYEYSVNDNEINFYCNLDKKNLPKASSYRQIVIGIERTDIFLVNKSNTALINNILNIINN